MSRVVRALTDVLEVAFLFGAAVLAIEAKDSVGDTSIVAGVDAKTDEVADTADGAEEIAMAELLAWTAALTSGCFPDNGVILKPQPAPTALRVLPYMAKCCSCLVQHIGGSCCRSA